MYKKILVPLDGSELAECVLPHVESIAKGGGTEEIVFIRVVVPFRPVVVGDMGEGYVFKEEEVKRIDASTQRSAKEYLAQLAKRFKVTGTKITPVVVTGEAAAGSLADYATKNRVDLIVIATHGRSGVSRWVWGNVADKILRSTSVPVLVVRAPGCGPSI